MSTPRCPVHPKLRALLDESGVAWSWVAKKKHWQLMIAGEVVLTSPYRRQDHCGRAWDNALACVRRALRSAVREVVA